MKASDLRIEKLLEFQPDQGRVLLNGSRVVIFDAFAMGKLRKDLIENLGIDRAKGFLIRYGWSLGYQSAITLQDSFQWDNEREWSTAGTVMHTISGFVRALPNERDPQFNSGDWYHINSVWENSVEAEQHILHLGHHNEPVCWMLTGFASGYASAALGKRVIFKEEKCIGKGDPHCTGIGMTVEDWGEEILAELEFYEVNKISEELAEANQRIKAQNFVLEQNVAIHERLTQCILEGKGVEDIAANLTELMKCTVVMENRELILQSASFPKQNLNREGLQPFLSLTASPAFNKNTTFYLQQNRPFQIVDQGDGPRIYRLVTPVLVQNNLLGYVSLLRPEVPFSETEKIGLEHAASVFALEILKKKEVAEVENRLKGDFVDDLLSGNFADHDSIINRARGLGYDISLPHRVMVVDINNFSELIKRLGHDEKRILRFKTDLANTIKACQNSFGKGIIVNKSDVIIILAQEKSSDSSEEAVRHMSELIIKQIAEKFPKITITIGIGRNCAELSDYRQSLASAKKAIEIGKALNKQGQAISLEQFGAHALLFSALNPADLQRFVDLQLGPLLAHDHTYQTKLIPTLKELLNQGGNIFAAARALNLSVSGMKYRLQSIEEILGVNPKNPQAGFNLQLALNILQLMGEENDKVSGPNE